MRFFRNNKLKKIEENNLKIVELKICILKITTWQNENISREIIAKNINLIADKLSTLQSIQQIIRNK